VKATHFISSSFRMIYTSISHKMVFNRISNEWVQIVLQNLSNFLWQQHFFNKLVFKTLRTHQFSSPSSHFYILPFSLSLLRDYYERSISSTIPTFNVLKHIFSPITLIIRKVAQDFTLHSHCIHSVFTLYSLCTHFAFRDVEMISFMMLISHYHLLHNGMNKNANYQVWLLITWYHVN